MSEYEVEAYIAPREISKLVQEVIKPRSVVLVIKTMFRAIPICPALVVPFTATVIAMRPFNVTYVTFLWPQIWTYVLTCSYHSDYKVEYYVKPLLQTKQDICWLLGLIKTLDIRLLDLLFPAERPNCGDAFDLTLWLKLTRLISASILTVSRKLEYTPDCDSRSSNRSCLEVRRYIRCTKYTATKQIGSVNASSFWAINSNVICIDSLKISVLVSS
jgi:hypothetical protein